MRPRRLISIIDSIQYRLDFKQWKNYQFCDEHGLGRISIISCGLSSVLTFNVVIMCLFIFDWMDWMKSISILGLDSSREFMLLQGVLYVITLCVFHLAEFFVTAIYNPSVVTANSFVVNHSRSYTAAIILSWTEFCIRFTMFPSMNSRRGAIFGLVMVIASQVIRSLSMITCGESFNHYIQHHKKENHTLVTTGIYKYLRHPSYFGFYYWSIGTQLLLGNMINMVTFAIASWFFFNRRIPFEESTLVRMFPKEYPIYMAKTPIGIPFIARRNKIE
jgi:protein-S-isoprenylcysteine O-methyltransferase